MSEGKLTELEKKRLALLKELGPDLAAEIEAFDETALRKKIVECEQGLFANVAHRKSDIALEEAKVRVTELGAPYKETKKHLSSVIEYALMMLESKGIL